MIRKEDRVLERKCVWERKGVVEMERKRMKWKRKKKRMGRRVKGRRVRTFVRERNSFGQNVKEWSPGREGGGRMDVRLRRKVWWERCRVKGGGDEGEMGLWKKRKKGKGVELGRGYWTEREWKEKMKCCVGER